MTTVSDAEFEQYLHSACSLAGAELKALINVDWLAYEGFDGRKTATAFFNKAKAAGKDEKSRNTDLAWIIAFALTKGSITTKNFSKIKDEGKTQYNALKAVYDLRDSKAGLAPEILTVPRIRAAFPFVTTRFLTVYGARDFAGVCSSSVLPTIFKNSSFPSLIPVTLNASVKTALAYAVLGYSLDQSIVIFEPQKTKTESDIKALALRQWQFVQAALVSSWPPTHVRIAQIALFKDIILGAVAQINQVAELSARQLNLTYAPITLADLQSIFP